jgi:ABC-type antimicrobial peptide transport system permease subunit
VQEQRWLKALQMRHNASSSTGSVDKFLTTSPITQDQRLVYRDMYKGNDSNNKGTLNQNNSYKTFMTTNKQRSIEMDLQSMGDASSITFSEQQPVNTRE